MKAFFAIFAAASALLPVQGALACAPPPPGYVAPTDHERLRSFVGNTTDLVYGIVTGPATAAGLSRLKILHVYRGSRKKGETVEAPPGWDYPVPYCAGMMGPPKPKPAGTYGMFALGTDHQALMYVAPKHVKMMIEEGWIRSAGAR